VEEVSRSFITLLQKEIEKTRVQLFGVEMEYLPPGIPEGNTLN